MLLMIGMGLFLFVFLAVMALMINPPEKWVHKLTDKNRSRR